MSSVDRPSAREGRVGSDARGHGTIGPRPQTVSDTQPTESAVARDRRWVEGTRRHDEAVFDDMYVAFHESMLRYAALQLGSRDEADEAVQDVFIDVWKLGERWTVRRAVSTYLFGALRRKIVDVVRRQKRRRRWFERAERGDEMSQVLPKPALTEAAVHAKELDERIQRALNSLPDRCQETLVLSRDYDCSYQEIAERMGVSRETVRTQLKRAYARMRLELADLR
jgi:RNA polymerase sigma-70 factor (family 1)